MKILPCVRLGLHGRLLALPAFLARQLPPEATFLFPFGFLPRLGSARGVYALSRSASRLAARARICRRLRCDARAKRPRFTALFVRASLPSLSIGRWWRMEGALHVLLSFPAPACRLNGQVSVAVWALVPALRPSPPPGVALFLGRASTPSVSTAVGSPFLLDPRLCSSLMRAPRIPPNVASVAVDFPALISQPEIRISSAGIRRRERSLAFRRVSFSPFGA